MIMGKDSSTKEQDLGNNNKKQLPTNEGQGGAKTKVSVWKMWHDAQPYQRRNLVLSGIAVFWAGVLVMDMNNLKSDPRVREKFKLDGTENGESQLNSFYSRIMAKLRPKDDDW